MSKAEEAYSLFAKYWFLYFANLHKIIWFHACRIKKLRLQYKPIILNNKYLALTPPPLGGIRERLSSIFLHNLQ